MCPSYMATLDEKDSTRGRANVFRLSAPGSEASRMAAAGRHYRGNVLFHDDLTFDELEDRFEGGATVKGTPLTDEFTWDDFLAQHGDSAVPLFVCSSSNKLTIVTTDKPASPKSGDRVIALVESQPEAAPARSE